MNTKLLNQINKPTGMNEKTQIIQTAFGANETILL